MKKAEIFIPSLAIAGAEKVVTDLALNMDKTDIDLSVVIISDSTHTVFYDALKNACINIIDLSGGGGIKRMYKVYHHLRQSKPDVIHANVAALQYLILPTVFVKIPRKFYTVHGDAKKLVADPLRRTLYNFAFHCLHFIPIAISKYVQDTFAEVYHMPKQMIPIINNGINLSVFQPITEKWDGFNIIAVGRLEQIKNYSLLIDAFKLINNKYPFTKLTILGSGSMKDKLKIQIVELALEDKVLIIDSVANPQDYMAKADVYMSTSITEGFSLTTVEALACGIPAVVTDSGGVSDIIEQGKNGYICRHNAAELAQKAAKLIENPNAYEKMKKNARESVKKFDIATFAEKYKKLYFE